VVFDSKIRNMNEENLAALEFIIKNRQSIRKFKEGEINTKKLEKMVELALCAPSSCNRQTIHFRFVREPKYIKAVAKAAFNQPTLEQPIILAVVCVDLGKYRNTTLKNNLSPYLDAGVSMQNFLLAATTMGLGTCVIAGRLDQNLIKDVLNLPKNWLVAALIAVGIPGEQHLSPSRNSVDFHISFDNEKVKPKETSFEEYLSFRRRWARAGFDVSNCYRSPKEGLPVFQHALAEINGQLKKDEHWLFTYSGMGEFLLDEENVDYLVASDDELWFLSDFLSKKAQFVHCNPIEKNANISECTYDRIVSPFDIHFLGDEDIPIFAENVIRWLNPNGKFILIFFNQSSFWGLNYLFARLLRQDVAHVRYFGYETPMSPKKVVDVFQKWFHVVDQKTISFLPPPNIGYILQRTKIVLLNFLQFFDFFGKVPIIRKFGNVTFLTLVKNDK